MLSRPYSDPSAMNHALILLLNRRSYAAMGIGVPYPSKCLHKKGENPAVQCTCQTAEQLCIYAVCVELAHPI